MAVHLARGDFGLDPAARAELNKRCDRAIEPTLESIPIDRPKPTPKHPQGLCLDRGYDYDTVRDLAIAHGYTPHVRTRGEELNRRSATPPGAPGAGSSKHATPGSTATAPC